MNGGADNGLKVISSLIAGAVNTLIFVGMAMAGMIGSFEKPVDAPLDIVDVQLTALPKHGIERPKKALPRIVQPPPPPPPETDTASVSRKIKEKEELEKKKKEKELEEKKKRKLAEEKTRLEEEERKIAEEDKRQKKQEKIDRLKRKRMMAKALDRIDSRADEDSPDGFADGDAAGNSLDPATLRSKNAYLSRVTLVLQRQTNVPAVISVSDRKRLRAKVHFRVNAQGKVVGKPRLVKKSGNQAWDNEVLRAVRKFGPGSALKIPLPPASEKNLRALVMNKGLTPIMRPQ